MDTIESVKARTALLLWATCAVALLAGCHPQRASGKASDASLPVIAPAPGAVSREAARSDAGLLAQDAGRALAPTACRTDADCRLTRLGPNCCPACNPFALPTSEADALEMRCQGKTAACVQPLCRPGPPFRAVCRAGRCEAERGRPGRE